MDLPILLFALALTGVTGVAFGVTPALRACSDAESRGLREGGRGGASRGTERLRAILVIAEVTASVSLLIGAGLLLRALWRLQAVDTGFRSEGVLTMRTNLPLPRYAKTQARVQLYRRILSDVRSLPGVTGAAYATGLPMDMRGGIWGVAPAGAPEDYDARPASMRFVTPGFFDAMGIPLRAGRDFAETDSADRPLVVVVSESLASRLWPGESALGRRIMAARKEREIVGVVADVRVRGHEQTSEPQVYVGYQQVEDDAIIGYVPKDLVVRSTAARPASLLPGIRAAIAKADPTLPVSGVRLLSEIVDADTAPRQVQLRLLGGFAALAFLLAGLGIHGLLAFVVSQRAREIGVRMALGAQAGSILRMVLRRGGALAAVGALLGAAIAYGGARAIQSILAGVSPADGPTFLAAAALALVMTLLGSVVPALRAARLDPAQVIRSE